MAVEQPRRLSARHIPALDGLRGIAILLVLGHHSRFILEPSYRFEHFTLALLDGGWCGVELFFVLSGFLITGILLDSKPSSGFFTRFYKRRILRIFPLYYAYLGFIFIVLAAWWSQHFHFNPWQDVNPAWYLLYLENFKPRHMFYDQFLAHLWSLAIEEQFYLVWPPLVLLLSRPSLGFVCVVSCAVALIARIFLAGHSVAQSFYLNTLTVASVDSLCVGALIALLVRNERAKTAFRPWIGALAALALSGFLLLAFCTRTLFLYNVWIQTLGITALNVVFGALVYWISCKSFRPLQALLSFRPLRNIGVVSYGMYVFHPLVIGFVLPKIHPVPAGTSAALQLSMKLGAMFLLVLITFLVALLSWHVLESPFLRLKDRSRNKPNRFRLKLAADPLEETPVGMPESSRR